VARAGDAGDQFARDLGWVRDVPAGRADESRTTDRAEVAGRVEGVVGVGVDP
jgi:hypothetical protein